MKIRKSQPLLLYFLLSLFFCATVVAVIQEPNELPMARESIYNDYADLPLAKESTHITSLGYVQNEVIVKFRENAANAIEMKIAEGAPVSELKISDSLDKLHKRYRLRKTTALFKNFRKKRQQLRSLQQKNESLLTKKEKRILKRLSRAPKNAKVPDLGRIYKIQFDLESDQSLQDVIQEYKGNPNVEYAELNYTVSTCVVPNDTYYPLQWPLDNTGQDYPVSGGNNLSFTVAAR